MTNWHQGLEPTQQGAYHIPALYFSFLQISCLMISLYVSAPLYCIRHIYHHLCCPAPSSVKAINYGSTLESWDRKEKWCAPHHLLLLIANQVPPQVKRRLQPTHLPSNHLVSHDNTSSSGHNAESNYNSEHHEDPSDNQASEGNGGSNNACFNGVCYSAM